MTCQAGAVKRAVVGIAFFALVPTASRAQGPDLPIRCIDSDSALGPVTEAQSRASLHPSLSPRGEMFVRTGTRINSPYTIMISVRWTRAGIAEPVGPQLVLSIPTTTFEQLRAAGDSVVLRVDDGLVLPLGRPTPATVDMSGRPMLMPLSFLITEEDLRSLAAAKAAEIRYGEKRFPFGDTDLASANALYRTSRCARAAERRDTGATTR